MLIYAMLGEGIKIIKGIGVKEKMNNDLTEGEIAYVEHLLACGYSRSFVAHTIIMARECALHKDIIASVDMIIERRKEG